MSLDGLWNASLACPPAPLYSLVGEWRLFFDTGAVRGLLVRMAASAVMAQVLPVRGEPSLPPVPISRVRAEGYTEVISELEIPAILGFESADEAPPLRRYRLRARFCRRTASLQSLDLTPGAREGGLEWALRRGLAVRGAEATDLPLVVPARLLPHAFEAFGRALPWGLPELAARLARPEGHVAVALGRKHGGGAAGLAHLRLEGGGWRQRLAPRPEVREAAAALVLTARPPSLESWGLVAAGGLLLGPCATAEGAEAFAATVGQAIGRMHFGEDCYWLLHKAPPPAVPLPAQPLLCGLAQRGTVFAALKRRGEAGTDVRTAGIRLGNALFLVAAAIALAADRGMALRLTMSASWRDYFTGRGGIFSQMPASLWYIRTDYVDLLLGSPSHMRYEALSIPDNVRTVMLHGYFQNARYFAHQLPLVRSLLSPAEGLQEARAVWQRQARPGVAYLAVHVRLGDRAAAGLGEGYYRAARARAAGRLRRRGALVCALFSDDPAALRGGLADSICPDHIVVDAALRDDIALMVMAVCCAGIVISASTFSWWAAVLGAYEVVVAPRTTAQPCGGDAANFSLGFMPGWTQLSVPCT